MLHHFPFLTVPWYKQLACTDNKGVVDVINSWSVGGRTQHVDMRYWWLHNMKEEGILQMKWIETEINTSDLFTKNLGEATFEKHSQAFVADD